MCDVASMIQAWLSSSPTSEASVNVSHGVFLAGRWLTLTHDFSDDLPLYRLDTVLTVPPQLCVTISAFITQDVYEQQRLKLLALQNTLPRRCTLSLL